MVILIRLCLQTDSVYSQETVVMRRYLWLLMQIHSLFMLILTREQTRQLTLSAVRNVVLQEALNFLRILLIIGEGKSQE